MTLIVFTQAVVIFTYIPVNQNLMTNIQIWPINMYLLGTSPSFPVGKHTDKLFCLYVSHHLIWSQAETNSTADTITPLQTFLSLCTFSRSHRSVLVVWGTCACKSEEHRLNIHSQMRVLR